jgi:hypothetical protein
LTFFLSLETCCTFCWSFNKFHSRGSNPSCFIKKNYHLGHNQPTATRVTELTPTRMHSRHTGSTV